MEYTHTITHFVICQMTPKAAENPQLIITNTPTDTQRTKAEVDLW